MVTLLRIIQWFVWIIFYLRDSGPNSMILHNASELLDTYLHIPSQFAKICLRFGDFCLNPVKKGRLQLNLECMQVLHRYYLAP